MQSFQFLILICIEIIPGSNLNKKELSKKKEDKFRLNQKAMEIFHCKFLMVILFRLKSIHCVYYQFDTYRSRETLYKSSYIYLYISIYFKNN